jgi:cytochrome c peroxidase
MRRNREIFLHRTIQRYSAGLYFRSFSVAPRPPRAISRLASDCLAGQEKLKSLKYSATLRFSLTASKCYVLSGLVLVGLIITCLAFYSLASAGNLESLKSVPIPDNNPQTPEKIELGKKLFFDRRLSGDGTMSCVTCHNPELAFTDGLDISLSYPTTKNWRNSPTLVNVAYRKYLFHDGRARTLEDQALFPMMSAFEMNKNLDYLEEHIRTVPEYAGEFRKVFNGEVTRERIAMAIASFERTLISKNTPLDLFLKGDVNALTSGAKKGFEVFKGKGRCIDCHTGSDLTDDKFYALNVPENPKLLNDPMVTATMRFVAKVYHYDDYLTLKEDLGRYLITKDKKDRKAFRTPTLRDIAKTAPYMHNGVFSSLEEVIDFFDNGGGEGNTVLKPLGLTADEKKDLRIFLTEALSGEELVIKSPAIP